MYHHSFFKLAPIAIKCLSCNKKMELLRGSVVQAWVNWEAFLGNLIRAVFRLVIGENDATRTVEEDRTQLIPCIKMSYHSNHDREKQLKRRGKAAAAFELIVRKNNWQMLLSNFLDEAIMSPIFAPGGNHWGINNTFEELFRKKGREFPLISRI